ncbi:hypothetical protein AA0472_2527 [Acetobacter estunensis NRIC 0472]|uniref:Uncharacterized protein n=1 Tax=Acetobacter estunensis TaxID=104097 RepID=A0A967B6K5_9PROT|nr:hypothetical protein [Acetobacter estunensis]NHO54785.1 hypothetical protein [Acetobacter estunensis]GBQ27880.1 hypothetical protein AA0472_2527 [Acetobacter estunensis NRIC 0472]
MGQFIALRGPWPVRPTHDDEVRNGAGVQDRLLGKGREEKKALYFLNEIVLSRTKSVEIDVTLNRNGHPNVGSIRYMARVGDDLHWRMHYPVSITFGAGGELVGDRGF